MLVSCQLRVSFRGTKKQGFGKLNQKRREGNSLFKWKNYVRTQNVHSCKKIVIKRENPRKIYLTPGSPHRGRHRRSSCRTTQSRESLIAGALPGGPLDDLKALGFVLLVRVVMVVVLGRVLDVVLHPIVGIVHEVLRHGDEVLNAAADLVFVATNNLKEVRFQVEIFWLQGFQLKLFF